MEAGPQQKGVVISGIGTSRGIVKRVIDEPTSSRLHGEISADGPDRAVITLQRHRSRRSRESQTSAARCRHEKAELHPAVGGRARTNNAQSVLSRRKAHEPVIAASGRPVVSLRSLGPRILFMGVEKRRITVPDDDWRSLLRLFSSEACPKCRRQIGIITKSFQLRVVARERRRQKSSVTFSVKMDLFHHEDTVTPEPGMPHSRALSYVRGMTTCSARPCQIDKAKQKSRIINLFDESRSSLHHHVIKMPVG